MVSGVTLRSLAKALLILVRVSSKEPITCIRSFHVVGITTGRNKAGSNVLTRNRKFGINDSGRSRISRLGIT